MKEIRDNLFLVMYHGGVMRGRGIEMLLRAAEKNKHIAVIILGNGIPGYIDELKNLAEALRIRHRVLFHNAVPQNELWKYVGAADAGVTLAPNICMNHYYMLPNKLFENIQSLTPVIGSNFPELRNIIEGYDIGLCVDPENVESIYQAIECLRTDRNLYARFKRNLSRAKQELCWEKEKQVLKQAYERILGEQSGRCDL